MKFLFLNVLILLIHMQKKFWKSDKRFFGRTDRQTDRQTDRRTFVDQYIEMRNVVDEGSHINPLMSRETMGRDRGKWRHFEDEGLCQLSTWLVMSLQIDFVEKLLLFFIFQKVHYSSIWYALLHIFLRMKLYDLLLSAIVILTSLAQLSLIEHDTYSKFSYKLSF